MSSTLTPAIKAKLRDMLEQARLVRAMHRAAYERQRELADELNEAQRECNRLKGADERRRWSHESRAVGAAAPGVRTYQDVLDNAQARVERLQARISRVRLQCEDAKASRDALSAPLESVAEHFKVLNVLGAGPDPLRALEDLVE